MDFQLFYAKKVFWLEWNSAYFLLSETFHFSHTIFRTFMQYLIRIIWIHSRLKLRKGKQKTKEKKVHLRKLFFIFSSFSKFANQGRTVKNYVKSSVQNVFVFLATGWVSSVIVVWQPIIMMMQIFNNKKKYKTKKKIKNVFPLKILRKTKKKSKNKTLLKKFFF